MNSLQIFKNREFGSVRTLVIDNEPWFVGKDVAEVLGYSNPQKALRDHVDEEDKTVNESFTVNGTMGILISESGVYALIFSSKLPKAKEFKHWVTSEVLPQIRKSGAYLTDEKAYDITHNPNSLADLLLQAGEQLKKKDIVINEMKPKALFADAVASSSTSILIGQLAKILTQNGYKTGQNRLFARLREEGYLSSRKGNDWNMPQQRYVEQGLFKIKESTHLDSNGVNITTKTVTVTGKGQIYFLNKFVKEGTKCSKI